MGKVEEKIQWLPLCTKGLKGLKICVLSFQIENRSNICSIFLKATDVAPSGLCLIRVLLDTNHQPIMVTWKFIWEEWANGVNDF